MWFWAQRNPATKCRFVIRLRKMLSSQLLNHHSEPKIMSKTNKQWRHLGEELLCPLVEEVHLGPGDTALGHQLYWHLQPQLRLCLYPEGSWPEKTANKSFNLNEVRCKLGWITSKTDLTCCDGPPTPLTGPAKPAGACAIGAPAGTPLPAALPTPGPPATPARGTRAMPVCNKEVKIYHYDNKTNRTHKANQKGSQFSTYIFRWRSFYSHRN